MLSATLDAAADQMLLWGICASDRIKLQIADLALKKGERGP